MVTGQEMWINKSECHLFMQTLLISLRSTSCQHIGHNLSKLRVSRFIKPETLSAFSHHWTLSLDSQTWDKLMSLPQTTKLNTSLHVHRPYVPCAGKHWQKPWQHAWGMYVSHADMMFEGKKLSFRILSFDRISKNILLVQAVQPKISWDYRLNSNFNFTVKFDHPIAQTLFAQTWLTFWRYTHPNMMMMIACIALNIFAVLLIEGLYIWLMLLLLLRKK